MKLSVNEKGAFISLHTCPVCGDEFTLCPPRASFDRHGCMSPECDTYRPGCDADRLFGDHDGYRRWLARKKGGKP